MISALTRSPMCATSLVCEAQAATATKPPVSSTSRALLHAVPLGARSLGNTRHCNCAVICKSRAAAWTPQVRSSPNMARGRRACCSTVRSSSASCACLASASASAACASADGGSGSGRLGPRPRPPSTFFAALPLAMPRVGPRSHTCACLLQRGEVTLTSFCLLELTAGRSACSCRSKKTSSLQENPEA